MEAVPLLLPPAQAFTRHGGTAKKILQVSVTKHKTHGAKTTPDKHLLQHDLEQSRKCYSELTLYDPVSLEPNQGSFPSPVSA